MVLSVIIEPTVPWTFALHLHLKESKHVVLEQHENHFHFGVNYTFMLFYHGLHTNQINKDKKTV